MEYVRPWRRRKQNGCAHNLSLFTDGWKCIMKSPGKSMKFSTNIQISLSHCSLDEAFLDVTENKPGILLAVDIAKEIKQKIRNELNLVGICRYILQ